MHNFLKKETFATECPKITRYTFNERNSLAYLESIFLFFLSKTNREKLFLAATFQYYMSITKFQNLVKF